MDGAMADGSGSHSGTAATERAAGSSGESDCHGTEAGIVSRRSGFGHPEKWSTLAVDDARVIIINPREIQTYPGTTRLAYLPLHRSLPEAPAEVFSNGERAEHELKDYAAALAVYRELSKTSDGAIRAGALMRIARTLKNAKNIAEALDVYGQAAHEDGVGFGNDPASLRARQTRLPLLSF